MNKICEICKKEFSLKAIINGKSRNLQNRKYCLECSPYGKHNTRKLDLVKAGVKVCSRCKETKPIENFARKNKDRLQSWCNDCLYITQRQTWKNKKVEAVNYLKGKCEICGYDKCMNALEFHHKDPSIKEASWNQMREMGKENIKKELDKCQLLCANCHREIHYKIFSEKEKISFDGGWGL